MSPALVRLRALLVKEFIQVFRDPRMRAVLFIAPMIQLFVLTYAATTDVNHVALAVLDRDASATSRAFVSRFVRSGYFDLVATPANEREAQHLLDTGAARAVMDIPPRLEADLAAGHVPAVQFAVDGTDANSSAIALGYASRITAAFARERAAEATARQLGAPPPAGGVTLETRAWFNPNLESRPFYVPGVLVMLITVITLTLTGMAIVREREIGTMEQLMVTPLSPVELLLGKLLPFAAIGLVDATLALGIAVFWFQVPVRGNLALFFLAIAIYLLTTLGGGLLISTLSRTQQQALLGTFFCSFPALLLSGFMFPIENMPAAIQWLTYLDPLRYIMAIMRGLLLEGLTLEELAPSLVALAVLGLGLMAIAVSRFRRTSD